MLSKWTNVDLASASFGAFTWGQFCRKCSRYLSLKWVWNLQFQITAASPRCQWVNELLNLHPGWSCVCSLPPPSARGVWAAPNPRWSHCSGRWHWWRLAGSWWWGAGSRSAQLQYRHQRVYEHVTQQWRSNNRNITFIFEHIQPETKKKV